MSFFDVLSIYGVFSQSLVNISCKIYAVFKLYFVNLNFKLDV